MSAMRATSPMKSDAARKIRATAAKLDQSHPEMVTGQHLRSAAAMLQAGHTDAAKRHLDAGMELLTPRNLIRHGVTDDEGHAQAKAAMHQINHHRLAVQDIEDVSARNTQQAGARRDALQAVVAARQQVKAEARTAAKPTGTGPGSQPQTGPVPDPILVSANPAGGIELAFDPSQPRDMRGRWAHTPSYHAGRMREAGAGRREVTSGLWGSRTYEQHEAEVSRLGTRQRAIYNRLQLAGMPLPAALAFARRGRMPAPLRPPAGMNTPNMRLAERSGFLAADNRLGIASRARSSSQYANSQLAAIDLSARTAMLERTPAPYGKPGGPGLYGKAGNKHSDYFEQVVQALMRKRGMDKATASRIAWGALRKWRRGGGHVHPEVVAAAGRALGQEAVAGARRAFTADPWEAAGRLVELACTTDLAGFNPAEPRTSGGTWGSGGQAAAQSGGKGSRAQRRAQLVRRAVTLRGEITWLLGQIHAATHHKSSAKSKSSTPAKKGAAAVSARQAAASKKAATAVKSTAKSSTKAAAKTMTLAQMKTRLANLREQLRQVTQQIHHLANEERTAIELARTEVWRSERRGPHGEWVSAGGMRTVTRTPPHRRAAKAAMTGTRPRSLRAAAGGGPGTGPRSTSARHGKEIQALSDELHSTAAQVEAIADRDAEARARAAAEATHQHLIKLEHNLDDIEAKKHRQKLVVHVMALVAGAVLTYLAAKLGSPELLTANLAPGALTIQELIDWRKRL